jgi:hypothetical protein
LKTGTLSEWGIAAFLEKVSLAQGFACVGVVKLGRGHALHLAPSPLVNALEKSNSIPFLLCRPFPATYLFRSAQSTQSGPRSN